MWEWEQAVHPERQDADTDAQGEVTRLRLPGRVIFAVPPRNNPRLHVTILSARVYKSGCRLHADRKDREKLFLTFNSENGIWI